MLAIFNNSQKWQTILMIFICFVCCFAFIFVFPAHEAKAFAQVLASGAVLILIAILVAYGIGGGTYSELIEKANILLQNLSEDVKEKLTNIYESAKLSAVKAYVISVGLVNLVISRFEQLFGEITYTEGDATISNVDQYGFTYCGTRLSVVNSDIPGGLISVATTVSNDLLLADSGSQFYYPFGDDRSLYFRFNSIASDNAITMNRVTDSTIPSLGYSYYSSDSVEFVKYAFYFYSSSSGGRTILNMALWDINSSKTDLQLGNDVTSGKFYAPAINAAIKAYRNGTLIGGQTIPISNDVSVDVPEWYDGVLSYDTDADGIDELYLPLDGSLIDTLGDLGAWENSSGTITLSDEQYQGLLDTLGSYNQSMAQNYQNLQNLAASLSLTYEQLMTQLITAQNAAIEASESQSATEQQNEQHQNNKNKNEKNWWQAIILAIITFLSFLGSELFGLGGDLADYSSGFTGFLGGLYSALPTIVTSLLLFTVTCMVVAAVLRRFLG